MLRLGDGERLLLWGWQTALFLGRARGSTVASSLLSPTGTALVLTFCQKHQFNTNSNNSLENEQLTRLLQTWADYCSSAELFWGIKTALRGWKPSYAKPFYSEKGERATAPGTRGYLHQKEEASVQSVRLRTLLICQHRWESKGYQAQRQEEEKYSRLPCTPQSTQPVSISQGWCDHRVCLHRAKKELKHGNEEIYHLK